MNKFCQFCGSQHTDENYPKLCTRCKQITWANPWPVAVLLQPVHGETLPQYLPATVPNPDKIGILVGKRAIEPCKGEWGLVGGFIDPKDKDVLAAARREFWEEMGEGELKLSESDLLFDMIGSFSDGKHLLIFVQNNASLDENYLIEKFIPNSECDEIRVAWKPEKLCFDSHTDALHWWFNHNDPESDYYA